MVDRIVFSLLALGFCCAPASSTPHGDAAHRFAEMRQLTGTWRTLGEPGSPLKIEFSLTADGTVLVERWKRGDQDHSMTLYHLDGAAIVATHYCPQGNQPRLMSRPHPGGNTVEFAFRDATDLDADEAYLTALSFDLSDAAVLVRRETYRQGDAEESSELKLARDPRS